MFLNELIFHFNYFNKILNLNYLKKNENILMFVLNLIKLIIIFQNFIILIILNYLLIFAGT